MASLFGSAIIAACIGVSAPYNQACTKAVDAGTRQAGWREQFDRAEDGTLTYANKEATKTLGKDTMWVFGSGFFVAKTVREKNVKFRLPNLGICNSVTNEITPASYKINFNWSF